LHIGLKPGQLGNSLQYGVTRNSCVKGCTILRPRVSGFFAKAARIAGVDPMFIHELFSLNILSLDPDRPWNAGGGRTM